MSFKRTLLKAGIPLLGILAAAPTFAAAQDEAQPAPPPSDDTIEEVVIVGSRIARDEGSYVGPMTLISSDAITADPNFSLNDTLSRMPAIGNQGTNRNVSNGGRGANFTDIHQLRPERTLTMFNGRRAVSTVRDSLGLGIDLQAFPVNMIERVEVLADGASSIYGSDAIAGVVNIIPKTEFEGLEISFGGGTPQDDGGDHLDAGVLFGVTGDRGFFTAGITAVSDGDVDYQDRSWSKIPLLGQLDTGEGLVLNLVGSGIPPAGYVPEANIIFLPNPDTEESFQDYDTFCLGGGPGSDGSGSIECILNQGHRYNYNDVPSGISLLNENRNINFGGVGEYNFENGVTGYVNTTLAYREGRLNFTALPIADAAGRFTDLLQVPFTNPNIPTDALAYIKDARPASCNDPDADPETPPPPPEDVQACIANPNFQMYWRGLDLGPRTYDYDGNTLSTTLGLKGDLELFARDFNWDTWLTVGRSELYEKTAGQVNVANLARAVDPVACALDASCPKDADGNPTLNVFGRSPKTAAEIAYTTFDDQERTDYEMLDFSMILTGDVAELPAGSVGFAGGVEYRKEEGGVDTSGVVQLGDSGGNFAEPTRGDYDVTEAYAEFSIPIVSGARGVEDLSLDLAGRYSDYSTFGNEFTYKASLGYAPVEQLRFRGTIGTGYRAPNILELFGGVADTYQSVTDPCSAPVADANVAANCTAAGVPPGFVQPQAQLKISAGGNEDLDAETSDSFTIGFVWAPDFAPLQVAIDWYDVQVDDAIGTPDPVTVITDCYNSPGGTLSSAECARIGRGATGQVVRFDLLNENLATVKTSGIDLNTSYTLSTGVGDLDFQWLLNYLDEYVETSTGGSVSDRTGKVAGATSDWSAYPEYRSNLSVTLVRDNWSAGLTWRYLDEMDVFDVIGFDNIHKQVDAVNYFDLNGTYDFEAWSLTGGIENLTDEEPPYVPDVSTNTSTVYDFLGRFVYARAKVSFK